MNFSGDTKIVSELEVPKIISGPGIGKGFPRYPIKVVRDPELLVDHLG